MQERKIAPKAGFLSSQAHSEVVNKVFLNRGKRCRLTNGPLNSLFLFFFEVIGPLLGSLLLKIGFNGDDLFYMV
jgi:hypothetical protein